MAPSTFASAAAGGNSSSAHRTDSDNDWSRRANGATQTFRRPSLATALSSSNHQREASAESQPARYVPPHRNGTTTDTRYSKDQLLHLFRAQHNADSLKDNLSNLYVGGWEPEQANGLEDGAHGWQKKDDQNGGTTGSDAFWTSDGNMLPLGLVDMTDEEREIFAGSVNSPMKIMTSQREPGGRDGLPLRKISISHNPNSPGGFSLNSPSATRPGGRRRETSESYPFPSNPLASPKPRDDYRPASPPPALRRRTTDYKDGNLEHRPHEQDPQILQDLGESSKQPTLQTARAIGGSLTAGLATPSSPWGAVQPSPGFAPMGAFGNFGNSGSVTTPVDKRPGFGGGRAESRFKGLMAKESNDDMGKSLKEKSSIGNFGKPGDGSSWRSAWPDQRSSLEEEHEGLSGSAALGGGEETSPPPLRGLHTLGTPHRPDNRDDGGFSAFGMTSDAALKGLAQDHHQAQARNLPPAAEAMSPTNTNPYQSPQQGHAEAASVSTDDHDLPDMSLHGLGGLMNEQLDHVPGNFGSGFGGPSQAPADRDISAGNVPTRGFHGLGGFGSLQGLGGHSGWGGPPSASAAPRPLHTGFGDSSFGTPSDLQSPSLAGLGPSSFFGSGQNTVPGAGRGLGRMGTFLHQGSSDAARAQDQLHGSQDEQSTYGFAAPGMPQGDEPDVRPINNQDGDQGEGSIQQSHSQNQANVNPPSNQPPTAQQRTMVMPDRMRWIYRDPQGNTQGPWSGLEMHDWYKAGFFSPELLVKKFEDTDYEPLAQLIRRIGNSREPFLVPQIGIPHGQPQPNWNANPMTSTGQPPFAASFPSFGTTLTAEQQNALERRKQEEQYLMARQKEHLAQQQMAQRMQLPQQHGMLPQQVQQQPGGLGLHSQPGFAASALPGQGYHPSHFPGPSQAHAGAAFADASHSQSRGFGAVGGGALGNAAAPDASVQHLPSTFSQLELNQQRQSQPGPQAQAFPHQGHTQQDSQMHHQQVNTMLEDRARLQQEQLEHDAAHQHVTDPTGQGDRLREFQQLQHSSNFDPDRDELRGPLDRFQSDMHDNQNGQIMSTPSKEHKTLTEQVQQAVSAKQSPASAWGKVDPALPQPFPPAPSQSPLPAPAAQRNRAHVADALHAESRSRSETPSLETPSASIAPWAKEPAEAARGPSLKEIQELEAKNAAKAEAIAAEARRAALEKETQAQIQASAAAAAAGPSVGLPSSSNWASGGNASPSIATPGSAWAKASKPATGPANAKSMAQIQKEEEARKRRLAVAALQAQQNAVLAGVANQVQGKRYAELASKGGPPSANPVNAGAAWTTVGASGKTKTPAATPTAPARTVSSGVVTAAGVATKKPSVSRTSTVGTAGTASAQEDFKKWAAGELRGDLNKSVNADEFVANLLAFPNEVDIVTEAVHSVSNTIDSRHFAEEFLRRRKLAEKGVFDGSSTSKSSSPAHHGGVLGGSGTNGGTNGGGWSEVAKKGPKDGGTVSGAAGTPKDDLAGSFKVVAAKKKGAAKR